ncbi:MAG: hypothetical protein OXT64_05055, partial [Gammaproteobacteria bacterium]|nr:hypothetical protein [Gammaproteobacteria bacterium]
MRIPEPLFVVINAGMRLLLRSPLHALASRSLMLITFTGRVTGRTYTTPEAGSPPVRRRRSRTR